MNSHHTRPYFWLIPSQLYFYYLTVQLFKHFSNLISNFGFLSFIENFEWASDSLDSNASYIILESLVCASDLVLSNEVSRNVSKVLLFLILNGSSFGRDLERR